MTSVDAKQIYHAGLGRTVEVPASTARVLVASGWVPVDDEPATEAADETAQNETPPVRRRSARKSAGAEPDSTTNDSEEE